MSVSRSFFSKNSMFEVSYYRKKETMESVFVFSIYKSIGETQTKDGKVLPLFRDYIRKSDNSMVKADKCTTKMGIEEIAFIAKLLEIYGIYGSKHAVAFMKNFNKQTPQYNNKQNSENIGKINLVHSETIVDIIINCDPNSKYDGVSFLFTKHTLPDKPRYGFMLRRFDTFALSKVLNDLLLLSITEENNTPPDFSKIRKQNIPETKDMKEKEYVEDDNVSSVNDLNGIFDPFMS